MKKNLSTILLLAAIHALAVDAPTLQLSGLPEAAVRKLDRPAVQAAFEAASKGDKVSLGVLRGIVNKAHSEGLPLGMVIYQAGQGDDELRRMSAETLYGSFVNGGVSWDYLPLLVDTFLLARDPPNMLFFDGTRPTSVASRLQGYEATIRDVCLESLRQLAFINSEARPPRAQHDDRRFGPSVMDSFITEALKQPETALPTQRREALAAIQGKLQSFMASPPPFAVARWRDAAERERVAMGLPAPVTPLSTSVPPSPINALPTIKPAPTPNATEAKPTSMPSEEPTSSTPWSVGVAMIAAAIGLLWWLLKKRE